MMSVSPVTRNTPWITANFATSVGDDAMAPVHGMGVPHFLQNASPLSIAAPQFAHFIPITGIGVGVCDASAMAEEMADADSGSPSADLRDCTARRSAPPQSFVLKWP